MVNVITQLIIGFSVISSFILWFAYTFFLKDMQKTMLGLISCTGLLAALVGLQLEHYRFLQTGFELFESTTYVVLLLAVPPTFYFFGKEILLPTSIRSVFEIVHLLPMLLGFVLPADLVVPVAFTIGTGYAIWFARFVYGMRRQVNRFKFEMFFFGFFAFLAVLILILAVLTPYIESSVFYIAYADFTGIALILIVACLIVFPELLADISEAAKITYAASTLKDVDVNSKLRQLKMLMGEEKIYQNESLNLTMLAQTIQLTGHQLSELINSQFGFGFSRYVREQRVSEAKRLLREDSTSSVLAISLMTGFRSQSNFYTAFREITGEAPGIYRKNLQSR